MLRNNLAMEVCCNVYRVNGGTEKKGMEKNGMFIVDTGATVSITSQKWLNHHVEWLKDKGQNDTLFVKQEKNFRFGNNNMNVCWGVARTPIAIGGGMENF